MRNIRALTICLVVLTFVTGFWAGRATATTATVPRAEWRVTVLNEVNAERVAHGLSTLRLNDALNRMAWHHSEWGKAHQTLTHNGLGPRATRNHYCWRVVGENTGDIVENDFAGLMLITRDAGSLQYPEHRANTLASWAVDIGIGIARDYVHNQVWFTEEFGRPC